jgi:two-component system, NtrC family, sensor kinase
MEPVVTTIDTKCKRCFSCIRQCPVNAIKFDENQARVLVDRCIACGNCIKVCPQHAKKIRDGIGPAFSLLSLPRPTIAVLAPSFPASFENIQPGQIISGLKLLGFAQILEVAFGADLVSQEYDALLQSGIMPTIISSPCPAVVNYIEKYYPHLKMVLAPIVSPMIAIGRAIKEKYSPAASVVFIGPCIAKKSEMHDPAVAGAIDEVLTFNELEFMFEERNISIASLEPQDFDGPVAGLGKAFPISRGLLKCTHSDDDILNCQVVSTEGRDRVLELLQKANTGDVEATFLDLLFCRGCIKGPMMANEDSVFVRKDRVVNYLKSNAGNISEKKLEKDLTDYSVNLRRRFTGWEIVQNQPKEDEIIEILRQTGKTKPEDELNCGACGYATCREKAVAVSREVAEVEMCLPFMLEKFEKMQAKLSTSNKKLRRSLASLRQAQRQLIQSEKLASIGRLAAGVAHELNNPLGGILLYSNILLQQLESGDEGESLQKVVAETERCRNIVKGLLDFSQQGSMQKQEVDPNQLLETTLNIVQKEVMFQNIKITKRLKHQLEWAHIDRLRIQQVLLNILLNAAEALSGHGQIIITSGREKDDVFLRIKDDGPGMLEATKQRIFDPFFSTKPVGQGTGLGMAVAYGIIQEHKGTITIDTQLGHGSSITIYLPIKIK